MNLPLAKIQRKLNLFFSFFNLKNNIVSRTSKSKGFKSITKYINMNLSYDSITLDKILNSKYINHFYVKKEMEDYYNSYKQI